MDEAAFRRTLSQAVTRPCPFERAILRSCAACQMAERIQIAERELLSCQHTDSHGRCGEFYERLRQSFAFALGKPKIAAPLPHGQEMRVQCGGLKGLQQIISGDETVENIDQLLDQALKQWGAADEMPFSAIVHAAASAYKGRHG